MVQPASLEDIDWGRTLLQPDVVVGGEFDLQMGEQRPEM